MNGRWVAVAVLLSLSVAACGFRFRGSTEALTDAGSLFVEAVGAVTIGKPLEQALAARDFRLVDDSEAADVIVRLADEQISERIVSVQFNGRVSEIELSHTVDLLVSRVVDDAAKRNRRSADTSTRGPKGEPSRVDVNQEYTYDERGVLGKEEEAATLRSEMRDELVRQVMLRTIASLSSAADSASQ